MRRSARAVRDPLKGDAEIAGLHLAHMVVLKRAPETGPDNVTRATKTERLRNPAIVAPMGTACYPDAHES
jgi:hypothetical protein